MADLCRRQDDSPACSQVPAVIGRSSGLPACSPFADDVLAIEAMQEALYRGQAFDADRYHTAFGFELRMREAYKAWKKFSLTW